MGLIALANYRFISAPGWGLLNRLAWLAVAAAPFVVLVCVVAAWVAQLGGNATGAVGAMTLALMWVLMAGAVFFRGMGRPTVRVWTNRPQATTPPDVIIYPALPPEDKQPPSDL